jgi:hypothetical protein
MVPTFPGRLCWTRRTSFGPEWRKETLGNQRPRRETTDIITVRYWYLICKSSRPATVRRTSIAKRGSHTVCQRYWLTWLVRPTTCKNYWTRRICEKKSTQHFFLKNKYYFLGVSVKCKHGFPPWRPWFDPSSGYVGFVVDKAALGAMFSAST